jgi:hypothetical protein
VRYLQWARKLGEVVHISQVESGAACQCVCDECGTPLLAKKGTERAHHFAHLNSDCAGNQETLMHIAAKAVIADKKRLTLKGAQGDKEVVFDSVEVEQQVGPYRVDLVGVKRDRRCMVEIAVSHRCGQEKIQYFRDNKLAAVEIQIDSRREFGSKDEYSEYVIAGAVRRWISGPMAEQESNLGVVPIDYEGIRAMQERRVQDEPQFLGQLRRAVGDRANQLHYGDLVEADLRVCGIPYPNALCVKSDDLPSEYGNRAMVMWHYYRMKKYLDRRVRFDIIYDYEQSVDWKTGSLFPRVVIRAVQGVGRRELYNEIGSRRWMRKAYSWI